jgi:DNA-binding NarL/FixJ family response regulator
LFIVEDSRSVADALADLLTSDGRCLVAGRAATEADALAWSFQNEAGFDVAIVDLLLGTGSGFAVLAHLDKYQPGKAVVFSEYVTPAIAQRCKSLGAAAAIPKSRPQELLAFVRALGGA